MTDSLRLTSHPVLNAPAEKRQTVTITVDGRPQHALKGETLAAALWTNGFISLGHNLNTELARGMYCGIGHCYECRVTVDGVEDVRSCLIPVRDGMRVTL
jgi:sarcosine oxidase subunit alpha